MGPRQRRKSSTTLAIIVERRKGSKMTGRRCVGQMYLAVPKSSKESREKENKPLAGEDCKDQVRLLRAELLVNILASLAPPQKKAVLLQSCSLLPRDALECGRSGSLCARVCVCRRSCVAERACVRW